GGISYFGAVGFILGPLILSFLLSLLSIYQMTILKPPRPASAPPAPQAEKTPPSEAPAEKPPPSSSP
ncbi:MAG: hypothetical protein PHW74_14235, partial [Desulfobacca sp.]|nr:hypothetical protein [Desulfobacca sp.]